MNAIYEKIRENLPVIKRYAISSLITFLSGFILTLAAQIETLNVGSFENGAAIALIITALRAGFKVLIETIAAKLAMKKREF